VENPADAGVDPMGDETRGILLALAGLGAGRESLDRLSEGVRGPCAVALQSLDALDRAARTRTLGAWMRAAASPLPKRLDRLHPSWIAESLAGEPGYLVRAVQPGLPESLRAFVSVLPRTAEEDPVKSNSGKEVSKTARPAVERLAFGWLAPLCESSCGALAERLCGLTFDALLSEVTRRGASCVGRSLSGAPPALRARAMAAAGDPWAQVIGAASADSASESERKTAMAHASARIPDSARTPSDRLLHIGLSALKSELADEHAGSLYRVAGRLPAALGRLMLEW
jgi:hypothetical protein